MASSESCRRRSDCSNQTKARHAIRDEVRPLPPSRQGQMGRLPIGGSWYRLGNDTANHFG